MLVIYDKVVAKVRIFFLETSQNFFLHRARLMISALRRNSDVDKSSIAIFQTTEGNRMNSANFLEWIDRTASLLRNEFGSIYF